MTGLRYEPVLYDYKSVAAKLTFPVQPYFLNTRILRINLVDIMGSGWCDHIEGEGERSASIWF